LDVGFWLTFKIKPELELVVIGLDMTTSSSSGLNLEIHPKKSAERPCEKALSSLTHVRAQILLPWRTEFASLMEQCFPIQVNRVEGFSNFCFWRLCDSFCIGRAEGAKGVPEVFRVLDELLKITPNSHMLGQFQNPENPKAHFRTTGEAHDHTGSWIIHIFNLKLKMRQWCGYEFLPAGPEIWEATSGEVDIFVAGVGTGGTITGTGRYLKSKNANVQIVGVEPSESAVLSGFAKFSKTFTNWWSDEIYTW
jgi:hypothetical protein